MTAAFVGKHATTASASEGDSHRAECDGRADNEVAGGRWDRWRPLAAWLGGFCIGRPRRRVRT